MKKAVKILSAASVMLLSLACNRLEKFEHHTFASFNDNEYIVEETAGTLKVPVTLYNCDGNVNVLIKAIDGTAVGGKDYSIVEPASGVLAFAKGETTKEISIKINDHSGEFTGNLGFSVELSSSTDGLEVGAVSAVSVTIKDLDHPLSKLFGVFSGSAPGYWGDAYTATIQITSDPKDVNKVQVYNLDTYLASNGLTAANGFNIYSGEVNGEENSITIASNQRTGYTDSKQGPVVLVGLNAPSPDGASGNADIVLNYNSDYSEISIANAFGVRTSEGWWEVYLGGITLAKK